MTLHTYNSNQPYVSQYSAAAVIGLGATGYSVVRYLRARGLDVTVLDSRTVPPLESQLKQNYPEVNYHFGDFDYAHIANQSLVIASPGVALTEPVLREAKYEGARIIGDVELFLDENTKPIIAITGSNGKSTVTTLVGEMCQAGDVVPLVAGNIGVPVLDSLTDAVAFDVAVLELSSFQLETTFSLRADAAAILNISADHMDRYDSMGSYVLAKARILRGAKQVVLPRHDEQLKQITTVGDVVQFDLDAPNNASDYGIKKESNKRWLMQGSKRLMSLNDTLLIGLHNVKNVLSAFALVEFLNLPLTDLVACVKNFTGLAHRMQTVAQANGVTWVNDSKATNIGATSTALTSVEKDLVWIAGGQGKGADFNDLRDAIGGHIKHLIVMGEDADQIAAALEGLLPITHAVDMKSAVKLAHELATKNTVVLLSPACASFDMFNSFEHRGDVFSDCVKSLTSNEGGKA